VASKARARVKARVKSAAGRLKKAVSKLAKDTRSSGAARKRPTKKAPAKKRSRLGHRPIAPAPASATVRRPKAARAIVEGGRVPAFTLPDENSQLFSSHVLEGERYVVYFYPRDDTPGCTKEACAFRDHLAELDRVGVRIIGISPDSSDSHARFKDKHDLPFTLLSDEDKKVAKAFGVWVKKQNYGREYMGIERSTFLIGEDGRVKRIWRSVKVPGHVESVLSEAQRG
jgi:thioredoxin-dependent peroxiredoxin